MEKKQQAIIVLCTCPDKNDVTETLATRLVESGLAACVNILPRVQSIYRWQGQIENETETLLIIKSTQACYAGLESLLKDIHPYDVPEIIMLSIEEGSSEYLKWLTETVSKNS